MPGHSPSLLVIVPRSSDNFTDPSVLTRGWDPVLDVSTVRVSLSRRREALGTCRVLDCLGLNNLSVSKEERSGRVREVVSLPCTLELSL